MHSAAVGHLWTCCLPDYLVTISEQNVSSLAFGNTHCLFLTQDGKVYSFGKGDDGQLGLGDTEDHMKEPCLVTGLTEKIVFITCGPKHSAAISMDGDVYMWGNNAQGQCGTSNQDKILSPTKVQITGPEIKCDGCSTYENKKICIMEIACGASHTLALSHNCELWAWGSGVQLGFANVAQTLPKKHDFLQNKRVLSVACGATHSLAVVESPKYTHPKQEGTSFNQNSFLCLQCKSVNEKCISASPSHICPLGLPLDKSTENLPANNSDENADGKLLDFVNENFLYRIKSEAHTSESMNCNNVTLVENCENAADIRLSTEAKDSFITGESDLQHNGIDLENESRKDSCTEIVSNNVSNSLEHSENGPKYTEDQTSEVCENTFCNQNSYDTTDSENTLNEGCVDNHYAEILENGVGKMVQEQSNICRRSSSLFDPKSAREFFSRQFSEISVQSEHARSSCSDAETSEVDSAFDVEKYHDNLKMPFVKGLVNKMKTTVDKLNFVPFGHKINEVINNETNNSDESFEVIESESVTSPSVDELIPLRRTGSLKSLIEIKHGLNVLKSAERKGSLESLMPKFWQKENNKLKISHSQRKLENGQACLQTELWSWGKGGGGILGHGDELDRRHPCCVTHLSGQGVVKVVCGGAHSIALTADCRVFSWGWNYHGQLGHSRGSSMVLTPKLVELPCHHLIWDVAAGDTHTLFLADLRGSHVALYYCGHHEQRENQMCVCPKHKNVHHLNILKKTGLVLKIFSGGPYSGCVVGQQGIGEVPILHEFAASERKYHYHLQVTLMKLLRAFLKEGVLSDVLPIFSDSLKAVIAHFAELLDMVAMNAYDLTLLVQGRGSIETLYMLDNENDWLEAYFKYSDALCDAVSVNTIGECVKVFSLSPLVVKAVAKDIVGEAIVESKGTADTLHYLLQFPLKRPTEYVRLLTRLATIVTTKGKDVQYSASRWKQLSDRVTRELHMADITKSFWDSAPQKVVETFRIPKRRLIRDSRAYPISLASSGRFSSHWFILFNDIFVHHQFTGLQSYALQVVWVDSISDSNNNQNALSFTTPEDSFTLTCHTSNEKTEWVCALNQAIRKVLDSCKSLEDRLTGNLKSHRLSPPLARQASYFFSKNPLYKDAVYSGTWICGKMHGHGELIWPDGRKYVGQFQLNMQHGEGVYTVPVGEKYQIYEGIWRDGKMNGFGKVRYPNNDVYEGYFKDDLRHGHGVLKLGQFLSSAASVYIGQWSHGRQQGYGVMDDICTGEKYMGHWMDDCRHGNGTVVTIDGIYYEGAFVMDKLSGAGVMMFEDNTCFEGELGPGGMLSGKGILHLSNKDRIEGCFTGKWSEGIKISGTYYKDTASSTSSPGVAENKSRIRTFNKFSVPADKRWVDLFTHCREALGIQGINSTQDNERAWEAVAVVVNKRKNELQSSKKKGRHISQEFIDVLERIPLTAAHQNHLWLEDYQEIKDYLAKACDCFFHPLGQLTERIVDVYRATYLGVGAHPRLLSYAVNEIHSFVGGMYSILKVLFPDLPPTDKPTLVKPKEKQSVEDEIDDDIEVFEDDSEMVTPTSLLHPILLPRLYPPLFTLYALSNEKEDDKYWERLLKWNKQSDIALMNFLGVDQKFWLIPDNSAFSEHRSSFSKVKDEYFANATETLQHISTAFTALEKLKIVHNTFDEINKEVHRKFKSDFIWTMDDLFPVFQYIVVRARIRHLGSEIHLIDDLMESHLQHGELGIMFTTLKACYFQIKTEKMPQL